MAQANCSICSRAEDTRALTVCPGCGQWVCADCLTESGVCAACQADEEE